MRGTVEAGLRRARKLSQVAMTCEEPSRQVYVVRGNLVKSLRRARNRRGRFTTFEEPLSGLVYDGPRNLDRFTSCEESWPSRYDVRGTVGAGLRRARKVGQVATTCEEPSGQVYVVRGKLAKSLRRARNRRGRFTSCEESWPSRYDVRGTVGAGLRRARKVGRVWSTTGLGTIRNLESRSQSSHSSGTKVYVVRGNLVRSLRRARNRRGRLTTCEEPWSGLVYDGPRNLDRFLSRFLGALAVYDGPRDVDNLGFGCLLFPLSGTKTVPRGATGSGHDGALTLSGASFQGTWAQSVAKDASPDYDSDSEAARLSSWAIPGSLAVTKGILSITLSGDLRSSVQRLSSTIWISPLLILASIECDIVNSTQHQIDSSISREITLATFAQPTLLRTFWENNLNDSASVHLGPTWLLIPLVTGSSFDPAINQVAFLFDIAPRMDKPTRITSRFREARTLIRGQSRIVRSMPTICSVYKTPSNAQCATMLKHSFNKVEQRDRIMVHLTSQMQRKTKCNFDLYNRYR
uniref:Uncharacterized protein n=1 Tax=Tanacetum cinerariifolium TaxID=118510 RepID=A0A6L2L9L3_TANCI|nr:hypothetical protein [Tanacetum cinerariifolium]